MAMKIRLARGGSKKRPFYRIVAADSRMPRDGRFIEKLGTYNPLLPKDSEERVKMNLDRIKHWMDLGAKPTDRISRMLEAAGVIDKKQRSNPKKAEPGEKAKVRVQEKIDKAAAAKEAAEAPVAEAVVEATPTGQAAAVDAPAKAVAASETASDEAAAPAEALAAEPTPTGEAAAADAPADEVAAEADPTEKEAAEAPADESAPTDTATADVSADEAAAETPAEDKPKKSTAE